MGLKFQPSDRTAGSPRDQPAASKSCPGSTAQVWLKRAYCEYQKVPLSLLSLKNFSGLGSLCQGPGTKTIYMHNITVLCLKDVQKAGGGH